MNLPGTRSSFVSTVVPHRLMLLSAALLACLVTCVGLRALGYPLVAFDDDINVTFNPHLGPPTAANLSWILHDVDYVRRYIPLGWLGFSMAYAFSGLSPVAYHAAALGFHALNTVLVYGILVILLGEWFNRDSGGWRLTVAFLGAAFWGLHPFKVETFGWASGLLYGQSACFALFALLAYLISRREQVNSVARLLWLCAAAASYLASLLTYPMTIGWFIVFFLVDLWSWQRGNRGRSKLVFLILEKWVVVVPAVLAALITVYSGYHARSVWPAPPSLAEFPLWNRFIQACYVESYYLWRLFWPFHLTPEPTRLIDFDPQAALFVGSAIALGLVSLYCLWTRRFGRALLFFWIAYVMVLAPMVGLTVTPHYTNDRYAYLPSLILTAALCCLLMRVRTPEIRRIVVGAAAVVVVGLAVLSFRLLPIWSSTDAVYEHLALEADYVPAKVHVLCRWALRTAMAGDYDRAESMLEAGEKAYPGFPDFRGERHRIADLKSLAASRHPSTPAATIESNLHLDFALDAGRSGRVTEARDHFWQALYASPDSVEALFDFAVFEAVQGEPRQALHLYLLIPPAAESGMSRARLLGLIADSFARLQIMPEARVLTKQAIALVGESNPSQRQSLETQLRAYGGS